MSNNAAITFTDVTYIVNKVPILKNITLDLQVKDITGILGPNGAGKSTLLSLVNGLHTQSSGTINVFNEQLPTKKGNIRKRIGVVLQETALYEELTTFENLRFSASLYDVQHAKQRIEEVLAILKLSDRSNQIVSTLSGGLRRRITIARALLHNPELLLIDEPTLGVDVEARHAIWAHLRLLKSQGTTIIVATNYLDEALALCDSVAVLKEGKLLTIETPQKLLARAGSCLDVACVTEAAKTITQELTTQDGIIRIDQTPSGLSIFLRGETIPEKIMNLVMQNTHIEGFRVRAPDLAEVFNTLEKE